MVTRSITGALLNRGDRSRIPLSGIFLLDKVTTTVDIVNTNAIVDIYRKQIDANILGIDRKLRLTILCDVLYNNNAADNFLLIAQLGAAIFCTTGPTIGALSPTRRPVKIIAEVDARTANSQAGQLQYMVGQPGVSGTGISNDVLKHGLDMNNAMAANLANANDLFVQIGWNIASVNDSFRLLSARLELI
jgi:hypothetical protein